MRRSSVTKETAGAMLREARRKADLSLADLGGRVDLSFAYLSDVERDRRVLPLKYWSGVLSELPTLDSFGFVEAVLASSPVRLDARAMEANDRASVARILARHAAAIGRERNKEARRKGKKT